MEHIFHDVYLSRPNLHLSLNIEHVVHPHSNGQDETSSDNPTIVYTSIDSTTPPVKTNIENSVFEDNTGVLVWLQSGEGTMKNNIFLNNGVSPNVSVMRDNNKTL